MVSENGRSEERRVGKEGRSRWSPHHLKTKRGQMRFDCDWSSDVCFRSVHEVPVVQVFGKAVAAPGAAAHGQRERQIGRASCRERGEISVVAASFKNKKRSDEI